MELVFVGWSHHGAPLDLREKLAFSPDRAAEALAGLFKERILLEGAIVSTCNRAEIYGLSESEDAFPAVTDFFSRFHRLDREVLEKTALSGRGDATVRHLFRVAAGLDSMVLGEAQILGQVREAHRMAAANKTARAVTNRLFQTAVECGKRVRTETGLSSRPASVPGIALSLAGRIFESLVGKKVLVLGAGEVAELTARLLVDEGVTSIVFCNRSPEKAAVLAEASGGATEPWERRHEAFAAADIVVSATGSPDPVVDAERLRPLLTKRARRGPLLVLDLAVPRDVDPRVDDIPDLYRYDVDSLGALTKRNALERQAEVPHAEAIVDEMVSRFADWYGSLLHVDVVRKLREALEKTRREELQRFAGKISELDPEGRALVERITESLLNKVLHGPTVGLKKGDPSERLQRAEVVKALFHLEDE